MARPIWSGTISFGLVSVPVKAYTAIRDHTVHFHQLEKDTGARIRYEKVSAKTGKEVPDEDIEKGFEVSKGHYVVVDDEEMADLRPRSTKAIEITDFVELAAVDPIYYERTYWLGTDEAGTKAYQLLRAAMEEAQRVAIGTVVMRNKQYLAAVRPLQGALAMSTMRFADEVVAAKDLDDVPSARAKTPAKELKLAEQIIDALASDWEPTRYHDTYTEQMRELIEAKAKGEDVTVEPDEEAPSAEVIDLMAALQASLDAKRSGGEKGGTRSSGRPAAAGKRAAKRTKATAKRTKASAKRTSRRSA